MTASTNQTLDSLLATHRAAVREFVQAAAGLTTRQWDAPLAPESWSPAQVSEHVRLCYELVVGELGGQPGLRARVPFWMRPWLRMRYFSRILDGVFPAAARAPRELRPGAGPFPQSILLEGLDDAASRFESEAGHRGLAGIALTHHVFGRISGPRVIQFMTVHTRHHRTQLPSPLAESGAA